MTPQKLKRVTLTYEEYMASPKLAYDRTVDCEVAVLDEHGQITMVLPYRGASQPLG